MAVGLLAGMLWLSAAPAAGTAATPQLYSESVRTSQYVTVRDGTRLAIDIYRPAAGGKPVETKLPVILVATPYHRSSENNNEILTFLAARGTHRNIFAEILKHGYVIASLDLRGRGASFGTVYGSGMESEANRWDLYDIVEWLAVQPFSDGSIGMGGCSYVGKTQFLAASAVPPHLKAIAPTGAPFDAYGLARVNGVTRDLLAQLDRSMKALDVTHPAAPVDEDRDGQRLRSPSTMMRSIHRPSRCRLFRAPTRNPASVRGVNVGNQCAPLAGLFQPTPDRHSECRA